VYDNGPPLQRSPNEAQRRYVPLCDDEHRSLQHVVSLRCATKRGRRRTAITTDGNGEFALSQAISERQYLI
jgi:hypothetical protein